MDVTPSKQMFEAMAKLTDAVCGQEPSILDHGTQANFIRDKRAGMMECLHKLVALSMREGVTRKVKEVQAIQGGYVPTDREDRDAAARAIDDAHAGRTRTKLTH